MLRPRSPHDRISDLCRRGEGWVALQVSLFAAVLATAVWGTGWARSWRAPSLVAGVILLLAGAALVLAGARSLGSALTPLPYPREDATLRDDGVYGSVRHPIYGGLMLISLGVSLCSSPLALVPAALLVLVLVGKSRREERWLTDRFRAYVPYRERVPHRFLPIVW